MTIELYINFTYHIVWTSRYRKLVSGVRMTLRELLDAVFGLNLFFTIPLRLLLVIMLRLLVISYIRVFTISVILSMRGV